VSGTPDEQTEFLERTYHVGPHDIEDGVDQMLGRDPQQHRPPRLAWDGLMAALQAEGIEATEQELIDAPITVEFEPEVAAELR
jgi:hypothetical protein